MTTTTPMTGWDHDDVLDRPREACGVVGVYALPNTDVEVHRNLFFALYALQHRGQESAGICTSDGNGIVVHRGMGLVSQVFTEETLRPLTGHFGIGHNRYSTTGSSELVNVQPFTIQTLHGPVAVAHNGNLTNAEVMREALMQRGVGFASSSDTEVITQFLARPPLSVRSNKPNWEARLTRLMEEAEGAFSLAILTRDGLYAMRDPHGLRPLCLGVLQEKGRDLAWVVASESSALLTIGAKFLREVRAGEIVHIGEEGIRTVREPVQHAISKSALCIFEYVYFARPDSSIDGQNVHVVRQRFGQQLAREAPADADVVIGVPDSSLAAAMAFAQESRLPYTEGLIKNRYIGRTFIQPSERMRKNQVRLKFNALRENLEGRRVVLVDDSIVRGTTMGPLVRLVREAGGASEVHVRIASPPVAHPCFMGVDLATHAELIATTHDEEAICAHVGADSLKYLSSEGMHKAIRVGATNSGGHCDACFSGNYPVEVSHLLDGGAKERLDGRRRPGRESA